MNLVLDIGNSFLKLAVFQNNKIVFTDQKKNFTRKQIVDLIFKFPKIRNVIISNVGKHEYDFLSYLKNNINNYYILNEIKSFPFKILYRSKSTLGNDRLAAVAGACNIFSGENVLVIDIGTAITYDIINDKKEYIGGAISPGIDIRYKSLNNYTNRLPLVQKSENYEFPGNDTVSSIKAGVQRSILFEIESYIELFQNDYDSDKVIVTGGDVFFFDKKLKNTIFAEPKLVAKGLNYILNYNVDK